MHETGTQDRPFKPAFGSGFGLQGGGGSRGGGGPRGERRPMSGAEEDGGAGLRERLGLADEARHARADEAAQP